MRWEVAYLTAAALGIWSSNTPSEVSAFSPLAPVPRSFLQHHTALGVGGGAVGWDNDNFLDALSKGSDALDDANEEYRNMSRFDPESLIEPGTAGPDSTSAVPPISPSTIDDGDEEGVAGATLTAEMKEKIKSFHTPEEEASQGAKRFRELMERAKQAPPKPVAAVPPPAPPVAPPPVPPAAATMPPDFKSLTVEEQARLFREMMVQSQAAAAAPPPAPAYDYAPPPLPQPAPEGTVLPGGATNHLAPGMAADGRKMGRNRDADAIVNSSDVYFAQLKRDSKVRGAARRQGDDEYANAVWADPVIKEIKLHVNPHMEEAKAKELAMLDTSQDERSLIDPLNMFGAPEEELDKSDTGISYKELMRRRREKKKSGGASAAPAAAAAATPVAEVPPVVEAPPPAPLPPPAAVVVEPPAVAEPVQVTPPPPPPTPPVVVESPMPAPVVNVAPPVVTVPPPAPSPQQQQPQVVLQDASPERMRTDLRTLMGMILKHRGGPGFGSGRLQGPDVDRFNALSESIMATLRSEVRSSSSPSPGAFTGVDLQVGEASAGARATSSPTAAFSFDRADKMVACLDGALSMYKNSPPALQESVLVTMRAALLSAVNTCSEMIVGDTALGSSSTAAAATATTTGTGTPYDFDQADKMVAYLEGAITMYKNSPPALQESILVTMQVALLSAIGTCNALISNGEVRNYKEYQATAAAAASSSTVEAIPTTNDKEVQFYEVVDPLSPTPAAAVESTPAVTTTSAPKDPPVAVVSNGTDENSQKLQHVYDLLQAAAGESGKMGLKHELSQEEASNLADGLLEARAILVKELDTGIPPAPATSAPANGGPSSKYQDMLKKARAEKDA